MVRATDMDTATDMGTTKDNSHSIKQNPSVDDFFHAAKQIWSLGNFIYICAALGSQVVSATRD